MRTFWIILALLIVLTAGIWFLRATPSAAPSTIAPSPTAPQPIVTPPQVPDLPIPDAPIAKSETPASPAATQPPAISTPEPAPAPAVHPTPEPAPTKPTPAQPATSSETLAAIRQDLANLVGGDDLAIKPVTPPASLDDQANVSASTLPGTNIPATPRAVSSAPPTDPNAPAKLEPQDDGTTLVDGRFLIKGDGSKANPYRVTWEMLMSAQDSYQPRLGRKIIPDRVKMLDGKWVKISGYIAFPHMAQSNDEMLMMLNQWDGCCIGVPPTPFDAVEVKLKKAAVGDDRMRVSGTLVGILRVDPYLVKDWLVSLYLMDDGEMIELAGQAAPKGEHAK